MPLLDKLSPVKENFRHLTNRPDVAKVLAWGKLASITGSAQLIVQAIGFACGILVIRLLPTKEYALYTLANTMLGTMVVLTDGGIANGVMAQSGKVWQDRTRVGIVLATGLELRKKFAMGSLLVATPILVYLLRHHDASWPMALLIVAALIPAFLSSLAGNLLEIAPRLNQDIIPLQKIQVGNNFGRLALQCLVLFAFPWAFIAVLAAGLPQLWANWRLRTISQSYADSSQVPDPVIRREILAVVKRMLPDAIYFCLSGQITVWLISLVGSTAAVAQVGALGRLAMLLTLFSVVFNTIVSPRFARLPTDSRLLLTRYLQLQVGLAVLCIGIVGGTWLFSDQLLWILGKNYANLQAELVLNMAAGCLSLMYGASFYLCAFRGWAVNPLIFIPISISSIALGVVFLDISTLKGIITLNIFVVSVQLVMLTIYSILKMRQAQHAPQISGV